MYLDTKIPHATAWMSYTRDIGLPYSGMLVTFSVYFTEDYPKLNTVVQSYGVIDDFGNFVEVPDANK